MIKHTTSTPKTTVTTPALSPGLIIRGSAWHSRRTKIRHGKQRGFGLGSLATFLIALAIPTVAAPPASATTPLILAAEPQCSSSKVLGGSYDARACVEGLSASRYRVTAYFTNGTDQQVDLTMKLSLAIGSSTSDLHTCSLQVGPRGNAHCEGWRSFSPAPSGSVSGQVTFTSSGRSAVITTATPGAPNPGPIIPKPTIPNSPGAGTSDVASASQALTQVNLERAKAGCPSLRVVQKLQAPAERQSRDQANRDRIGHDGADGSKINDRLGGLGYSRWAENVAQYQTAPEAVNSWLTSTAGHRENMLNCAFTETGLAVARSASGKLYWTQTFGG